MGVALGIKMPKSNCLVIELPKGLFLLVIAMNTSNLNMSTIGKRITGAIIITTIAAIRLPGAATNRQEYSNIDGDESNERYIKVEYTSTDFKINALIIGRSALRMMMMIIVVMMTMNIMIKTITRMGRRRR